MKNLGLIGITLAAAAVTLGLVVACSDGTTPPSITCTSDGDCRVGEICHPDAKVCVQTCTAGADCPDSSKNCAAISSTNSQQICKCVTTPLCQGGSAGADSICSSTFSVCTPKCASNVDCGSGLTCDTASGECKPGATDGGTDGGTGGGACDWASEDTACSGGQVCDIHAGSCGASVSCTGTGQATVCSYGSSCESGACAPVPRPSESASSCSPYSHGNVTWDPKTQMGPVIYDIQNVTDDPSKCTAGTAQTVQIKAYSPTAFPTQKSQLNGFNYIKQDGTPVSIPTNYLEQANYQGGGTNNITATFTLCNSVTSGAFSAGFEFANGNQRCFLVE